MCQKSYSGSQSGHSDISGQTQPNHAPTTHQIRYNPATSKSKRNMKHGTYPMHHYLTLNGLDGPMLRQFGCDCARCTGRERLANTSASLISLDDQGQTAHHILFDVGLGVVDSLVQNPHLAGTKARLDWIVLTHWHPDHTLELNRVAVSYRLRRRPDFRIPTWCRSGSADWLHREHGYDMEYLLQPHKSGEYHRPGTLLPPLPIDLPGVTITPVTVSHLRADISPNDRHQTRYSCAVFIIETARSKTVLLWDIDSENEWLVQPTTAAEKAAVQRLSGANHLFIDTGFWQYHRPRMSHPGFYNVRRIARTLQPQETLLVHLSGHPDGPGQPAWGWSNAQWSTQAAQVWQAENLPGRVRVPAIGERFDLIS